MFIDFFLNLFVDKLFFKGPYAYHILIPYGLQLKVVYFFVSNESPYIPNCKFEISPSKAL